MPSWTQKLHLQRNDRDTSRLWIPKSVQAHRRAHWRPVTRSFESTSGEAALAAGTAAAVPISRFGGRPLLCASEAGPSPWRRPHCGNCGAPMALLLQLASRELPREFRPFGDGVLQLFYCVSEDPLCEAAAEAFVPFGFANLVRVIPAADLQQVQTASQPVESVAPNLPCRLVTGWVKGEDFPSRTELKRLGLGRSDAVIQALDKLFPASVDKLGGWPYWRDFVNYPSCATCGEEMDLVFQIEANKNLARSFGPAPCAYVFGCKGGEELVESLGTTRGADVSQPAPHPVRLGFGWSYGG